MIRRPPRSTRTHSFPTRRSSDLAKDWGISAKSSSTDRTVAAIQSFGLIEDSGSGENRKIKLSELGARILADARPGVRESLLAEAALKRSEEHTSELQSLMRISYAVFCLKKK